MNNPECLPTSGQSLEKQQPWQAGGICPAGCRVTGRGGMPLAPRSSLHSPRGLLSLCLCVSMAQWDKVPGMPLPTSKSAQPSIATAGREEGHWGSGCPKCLTMQSQDIITPQVMEAPVWGAGIWAQCASLGDSRGGRQGCSWAIAQHPGRARP